MNKEQLKKNIKKIPGITRVHRTVADAASALRKEEPGDYLFREKILSWISEPSLKRQLPPLYRLFVPFFVFTGFSNDKENSKFRRTAFSLVSRLAQFFRLSDSMQLDLPEYKVCINLLDPRCFKVISELLNNTALLSNFLSAGDTFIDVGANHGSYSILASKLIGANGLVISIEPQPRLAELLETSLSLNQYSRYEVHQIACGDRNDSVEFYIPNFNSGEAGIFSSLSARHKHQTVRVLLKRFDEAFDWRSYPGRIFLKLDIEGSEYAFLNGAREMISARKPVIRIEINPASLHSAEVTVTAFKKLLFELGYRHFFYIDNLSERRLIEDLDATRERDIVAIPAQA
ncbi:MAG: FkbM family methyltransferase [Nitrospirae bacterium]|nr:FkbM family methyltransferase [Nitrospirota bacterium]